MLLQLLESGSERQPENMEYSTPENGGFFFTWKGTISKGKCVFKTIFFSGDMLGFGGCKCVTLFHTRPELSNKTKVLPYCDFPSPTSTSMHSNPNRRIACAACLDLAKITTWPFACIPSIRALSHGNFSASFSKTSTLGHFCQIFHFRFRLA